MHTTLNHLKKNQQAIIIDFDVSLIPFKLIEMGCLPDANVNLLQVAPLGNPMYFNIDDSHIAIDRELAQHIKIEIIPCKHTIPS